MNREDTRKIYDELNNHLGGIEGKVILNVSPGGIQAPLVEVLIEKTEHTTAATVPSDFFTPGNQGLRNFNDETFDLAFCDYFVYPGFDVDFLFREIQRTLKSGGHYLSDERGWERPNLQLLGFADFKEICHGTLFYARKPK